MGWVLVAVLMTMYPVAAGEEAVNKPAILVVDGVNTMVVACAVGVVGF